MIARRPHPAGFLLLDALVGLMVLGILAAILSSAVSDYGRTGARLGERSDALHQAEALLQQLQSGQAVTPPQGEAAGVSIARLTVAGAPAGYAWVEIKVLTGRASAPVCLTGLVPAGALEGRRP